MPELPELAVVVEVLRRRVVGTTIQAVQVSSAGGPIVIRDLTLGGFELTVTGKMIDSVNRRGKFLLFDLKSLGQSPGGPLHLIANPKLMGRFQLAFPTEKRLANTHVFFCLSSGDELRYVDQNRMGQLYLTHTFDSVPDLLELGPEPFEITAGLFHERLCGFHGEIKGILTRGKFIAGIGNAYADEILWAAHIHPYRKRNQLTFDQIDGLFHAMQETLHQATEQVRAEMGERIHLKPRDFLAVHRKSGQPCPRCGTPISLIGANQRVTNFCRTCQPGGLIRGM